MRKTVLMILSAVVTVLVAAGCCGKTDLEGKWNITVLNGEVVAAVETDPFIEFDTESGKIHGHTGCNIMNGSFTVDGRKLTFDNVATTMMAGPDMELENGVLDAINATAGVKALDASKVQLIDAEGNVLMELERQ